MSMSPGYKNTYVGRFYEDLAKRFLGGKLTRNERGDLFIPEVGASVEVKASGERSNYGFRVCLDQLERYTQRLRSAESAHVWYVLCFYRNKDIRLAGGRKTTEFASHHTNRQVRSFLRQRTSDVFILDLSVVQHIALTTPASSKSIIGHLGRKTLDIKKKHLTSIVTRQSVLLEDARTSYNVHLAGPPEMRELAVSRLVNHSHLTERKVLL